MCEKEQSVESRQEIPMENRKVLFVPNSKAYFLLLEFYVEVLSDPGHLRDTIIHAKRACEFQHLCFGSKTQIEVAKEFVGMPHFVEMFCEQYAPDVIVVGFDKDALPYIDGTNLKVKEPFMQVMGIIDDPRLAGQYLVKRYSEIWPQLLQHLNKWQPIQIPSLEALGPKQFFEMPYVWDGCDTRSQYMYWDSESHIWKTYFVDTPDVHGCERDSGRLGSWKGMWSSTDSTFERCF